MCAWLYWRKPTRYKHVFETALAAHNADRIIAAANGQPNKGVLKIFSFDMLGLGQSPMKFCERHGLPMRPGAGKKNKGKNKQNHNQPKKTKKNKNK